jgi:hypothetical protein
MKKLLIAFMMLFAFSAKAQTKAQADSLNVVKEYVLNLQSTVNSTTLGGEEKVRALTTLLETGTKTGKTLKKNLGAFVMGDEYKNIAGLYGFIVQSAILYKTDLKSNNYKEGESAKVEAQYLNGHVPSFCHKLQAYIDSVEK